MHKKVKVSWELMSSCFDDPVDILVLLSLSLILPQVNENVTVQMNPTSQVIISTGGDEGVETLEPGSVATLHLTSAAQGSPSLLEAQWLKICQNRLLTLCISAVH